MVEIKFLILLSYGFFFFGEVICVLNNNDSARVSSSPLLYDLTTMSDRSISKQHGFASPTPVRQNSKLRKRGKRGGVRVRTRKKGVKKPFLPVVVLGNVRSLNNKTEELQACTRHLYEYRESSIMCFPETWLTPTINDSHVNIDGFTIVRSDRTTKSGKQTSGGAYINDKSAHNNNIHIKNTLCTPVSIRPYYLPREIPHVIINAVYIPPEANTTVSTEIISDWLHELETSHPNSLRLVFWRF